MELLEGVSVALGSFEGETDECPFDKGNDDEGDFTIEANDGTKLGKNLEAGSPGKSGTFRNVEGDKPPEGESCAEKERDIYGDQDKGTVVVDEFPTSADQDKMGEFRSEENGNEYMFPYKVAAHHIIPGNASLRKSAVYILMVKPGDDSDQSNTGKVKTLDGRTFEIKKNMGYNANGAHNGVWLPGNYAISPKKNKPLGKGWADIGKKDSDWQKKYVEAVVNQTGRCFHDTHEPYSNAVLKILNKISFVYFTHMDSCDECKEKNEKSILPPYKIKLRLYALSNCLKPKLMGTDGFKKPWLTTSKWEDTMTSDSEEEIDYPEEADINRIQSNSNA